MSVCSNERAKRRNVRLCQTYRKLQKNAYGTLATWFNVEMPGFQEKMENKTIHNCPQRPTAQRWSSISMLGAAQWRRIVAEKPRLRRTGNVPLYRK